MSADRRYNDDEVAAIFEAAATTPASRHEDPAPPTEQGLTLTELQAIGKEVGIPPERIAQAAAAVERVQPAIPRRTDFGMPVSAAHVVDIPRPLTDREWSLVVADLRETFGARGKDVSDGTTRQWWNSNLHAVVEPTRTGYRLRLGTLKGDGLALNRMGLFGVAMGVIFALVAGGPDAIAAPLLLGTIGAGAIALNAFRLPRWARLRERQMEAISQRALALIGSGPDPATD